MPFIGKTPETGAFRLIDSITTSATDTYALTVQGDYYFPASARNLIVSLNGVTQAPETAYTVSGSHIVFASALTSSDVIDYILVIGDAVDIGTPSDGTVGTAQMNYPLGNFSSTGIDDNATSTAITIDADENIGVGHASPVSLGSGYKNVDIRYTTGGGVTLGDPSNIHAYLFSDNNGVTLQAPGSRSIKFTTGSTTAITVDDNQNVGVGVTPESDSADGYANIRLGGGASFMGADSQAGSWISSNAYFAGSWKYITTNTASSFLQTQDVPFRFRYAASGTAGSAISWTEAMRVDTSGNLGVGTSSPADRVHVEGGNLRVGADDNSNHSARVILNSGGASGYEAAVDFKYEGNSESRAKIHVNSSLSGLIFSTIQSGSITEDMRLDGSGNLLVGKTSLGTDNEGMQVKGAGELVVTRANNHAFILNRKSSNGDIALFQKDGSTKGSIGINSGDEPYFARSVGTTSGIKIANGALYPCQSDGTDHDNAQNLGRSNVRWANLYLSGGAYLGGTTSANYLDDYEEGTWTPALTQGSATFLDFKYIKIGNFVYVTGFVYNFTDRSTAGNFNITGLPFTSSTTHRGGQMSLYRFINRGDAGIVQYISANTSTIAFYGNAKNADYEPVYHSHMSSSATNYYISVSYRVD